MSLTARDAERLEECLASGGVALIPTDTIYGLGCDPSDESAVRRLYAVKGRNPGRPAAVMFLSLEGALEALPEVGQKERGALRALLPGALTVLLANRAERFPLACGPERSRIGLRVPALPAGAAALSLLTRPIMQSSANLSGGPEARALADVEVRVRDAVDLALDGGTLPGVASTVLDLSEYENDGRWEVIREGPVSRDRIAEVLC